MKFLKWLLILIVARCSWGPAAADGSLLGPFERPRPRELSVVNGDERFNPYDALHGSYASPELCGSIPDALWVEVDGKGDCIRYYAAGLADGPNPTVLLFLGGDALLRNSKGVRFISETYGDNSPASLTAEMADWSAEAGKPAIFIARPGLYGSSGDHGQRRRLREIDLVNGAVEQLKRRYGISDFILAGQSGGGHIVAALLNGRDDISAAVISSGLLSVRRALLHWKRRERVPGRDDPYAPDLYDPVDEVDRIRRQPSPKIYVLSDPTDIAVPFFTQLHYVRRLRAVGLHPRHIYLHGSGRKNHLLVREGRLAAAMLARGASEEAILKALAVLELQPFR